MADIAGILAAKRLGMPTWVWATGGVAVAAFIVLKMRANKAAAAAGTTGTTTGSTDPAGNSNGATLTSGAAFPMPYSGGDVFVNYPNQPQAAATADIPTAFADLQTSIYVVKGVATPAGNASAGSFPANPRDDTAPTGIAQVVYNLGPNDIANATFDGLVIMMLNPGLVAPYPVGTQIKYPTPNSLDRWTLAPTPQTTSVTTTAAGGTTPATSASGM